jgi:flagellar basal-body rod protein FlgF
MTYGLWLSAGGMQVNEYRQSVMANNLANTDTVGFKRDLAVIHERRPQRGTNPADARYSNPLLDPLSGGAWTRPTFTSFGQGGLTETGRALDVALEGDGFLVAGDGTDRRYTRDGRMTLDPDGMLRLAAGEGRFAVLDAAGVPIVLDRALGEPSIGRDGSIRQNNQTVAQLGLVDFADRTALRKSGHSLFEQVGETKIQPARVDVLGGYVESSTADAMRGLVDMIEVSRAYELNARMVTLQDTTLGAAVTRVGRIG